MQYRENPGNKDQLSILGYGCLRYSKKGTAIDQEKAEREMAAAVDSGNANRRQTICKCFINYHKILLHDRV